MTSIEITFLGTTAGIPTKQRNHASLYVTYRSEQEFRFLFDCGEGTQRQMLLAGLNFMRIDNIFISHWHADHYAGLLGLWETMNLEKRREKLRIFGPESEKFVNTLLSIGYASKKFSVVPKDVPFEGHEITVVFDHPEFQIISIPARHSVPAVIYALREKDRINIDKARAKKFELPDHGAIYKKIKEEGQAVFKGNTIKLEDIATIKKGKTVVYSGDTLPTKNMIKIAKDADLLIHDSTFFDKAEFSEDKGYKHANFDDVIAISEEANVKSTILTHISRRYQDVDMLKEKIKNRPNLKLAKDFMTVVI